jgi:hypothetical protein
MITRLIIVNQPQADPRAAGKDFLEPRDDQFLVFVD